MKKIVTVAIIFCILFNLSEVLSDSIGIKYIVTMPMVLSFVVVTVCVFAKEGLLKRYSIAIPVDILFSTKLTAPLLLLPCPNLIFRGEVAFESGILAILFVIIMASIEELVFRGILLYHIGFVPSSALFAVLHFFTTDVSTDIRYRFALCAFAFGVGVCFTVIVEITGSIIPSTVIHILINLAAIGANNLVVTSLQLAIWILIGILCLVYGVLLRKKFGIGREGVTPYNNGVR